jgi:hypothetical protein
VPLVELGTVNNLRYYTDSNGIVAFNEPGLMGTKVFFSIKSHGYEFPKDGFGFRGKALDVTEGGSAKLSIRRINLAERLYRVTGAGIYADSLLVGQPVPIRKPLLNAQVLGSDSVVNAVYRGKIYWFWGDTNRASYPLGNFHVPGATSELPGKGGLDPDVGVDLDYRADEQGFARPMARMPGEGPTWIFGLAVVRDGDRERLFADYMKVRGALDVYQRGLVEFNDERQQFEKVAEFPANAPVDPGGHTFVLADGPTSYVYFAQPFPLLRVRAEPEALRDLAQYESYTPLVAGTRLAEGRLDRGPDGKLRYGWKRNTPPLRQTDQAKLVKAGKLRPEEVLLHLRDADTGKTVIAHSGSVYFNRYRGRWVLITVEVGGTSYLGEVWYAEGDAPLGPWVYARKIVTHERMSFYNPKQHPFFDKENGRIIYFEGTYTHSFSGNAERTPRYEYNQVCYRLDVSRPELVLPVPVYRRGQGPGHLGLLAETKGKFGEHPVTFFALDRPRPGAVPVYAKTSDDSQKLHLDRPDGAEGALFHALPADTPAPPATTAPLYEWNDSAGRRAYSTAAEPGWPGFRRAERPLCLVWRSPAQEPRTE